MTNGARWSDIKLAATVLLFLVGLAAIPLALLVTLGSSFTVVAGWTSIAASVALLINLYRRRRRQGPDLPWRNELAGCIAISAMGASMLLEKWWSLAFGLVAIPLIWYSSPSRSAWKV